MTRWILCAALVAVGCSKSGDATDVAADAADVGVGDAASDLDTRGDGAIDLGRSPDATYVLERSQPETARLPEVRGKRWLRGIIHAHSIHSHDACDGEPVLEDGTPNEPCLEDFRRAICETRQDYVFLTDHEELAAYRTIEELALIRDGDTPIYDADQNVIGNQMPCANGHRALLIPGGEFGVMPIGMPAHLPGTDVERDALYQEATAARVQSLRDLGAVVLQAHAESRDRDTLRSLGVDGFEVYQLHANVAPDIREEWLGLDPGGFLNAAVPCVQGIAGNPDLVFLTFVVPNAPSVAHFDALTAEGQHLVGTGGTDCHQNVLPLKMKDGERVDGYRRMMRWFSNHILADGATIDDAREAIQSGRLAIVFEILGTPIGFDYYAEARGKFYGMGETASLAVEPVIHLQRPDVLDWGRADVRLVVLRTAADGAQVVAEGSDTLEYTPTEPGAYRAVVYITPEHLATHLEEDQQPLAAAEYEWIWANPVYIDP